MKRALYLPGGGARGAYQAGVLHGIHDILQVKQLPVQILSSVSAGAINAAYLAMHVNDFPFAVSELTNLWSTLSCDKIFATKNSDLIKSIIRNMLSIVLHFIPKKGGYLLDTTPLKNLLDQHLDFDKINRHITDGLCDFEVATTCYDTAETISFLNSAQTIPCWSRIRHSATQQMIKRDHILASAAFPLFFPPVEMDNLHFGDGGIRLSSPLRAARRLGATDILIISTRATPALVPHTRLPQGENISFAKILGNMLNALVLDNIDRDMELIDKINYCSSLQHGDANPEQWRHINALCIRPSIDIGQLAVHKQYTLPLFLRYLLRSFGARNQSGDFLSFLLFESVFCKPLVELGYADALKMKTEILQFFETA